MNTAMETVIPMVRGMETAMVEVNRVVLLLLITRFFH
jgi:hypothetical protein